MGSCVDLDNISLRFRISQSHSNGVKETVMRWLRPPSWYKTRPPRRHEFWGLKNIELHLEEGDRLAIIGHNGAGKSSLLKVISRIYRPTRGEINVEGRIAPLIEIGAGFNPELSGRENAYLNGSILGLSRKVIRSRMDSIIEFSELKEFIDVPVKYYSTGMHLRLAFTIATEVAPDILILDELFAGGDASFVEVANRRLDQFVAHSKILILVTHNFEYVDRFCNKAVMLDHGEIALSGRPDEVVSRYLKASQTQEIPT